LTALILILGALCSTSGTLAVKNSNNFRNFRPTVLAIACYSGATWFLAQAMHYLPIAVAHAAWSGTVALLLLGVDRLYLKLRLSFRQIAGLLSILAGIALLAGVK